MQKNFFVVVVVFFFENFKVKASGQYQFLCILVELNLDIQ